MNKVIIDKEFFNFTIPASAGLISGLKKLAERNFVIDISGFNLDDNIERIFKSEGILINHSAGKSIEKEFTISLSEQGNTSNIIFVSETGEIKSFSDAVNEILRKLRSASVSRNTKETKINITLCLDGSGKNSIRTGIGFFDHMLEQIARHANIDVDVKVEGDLHVDEHHSVEDTGIALGTAIAQALGDKKGIKRYGFLLPMDESFARCSIDLSGRSYLNFKCKFERDKVGEFPTELTEEFFRGLASGMKANILLRAKGKNDHHKIEAMFKAFAKSLNEACRFDERSENKLPSTKGIL